MAAAIVDRAVDVAAKREVATLPAFSLLGGPGDGYELRVLAYLERLGVLDPLAPGPAAAPGAAPDQDPCTDPGQGPDHGDGEDHGDDGSGPDGGPGGGREPGPGNGGTGGTGGADLLPGIPAPGLAARVNLTVPLATALGLADPARYHAPDRAHRPETWNKYA